MGWVKRVTLPTQTNAAVVGRQLGKNLNGGDKLVSDDKAINNLQKRVWWKSSEVAVQPGGSAECAVMTEEEASKQASSQG